MSLETSNAVYLCSERAELELRSVQYPEFERFSFALRAFQRSLGEAYGDDYWREFLWPLRSYGFRLLAAPLPSGHPAAYAPDTVPALRRHLAACDLIYPDLAGPARRLLDLMDSLVQAGEGPLLDAVWELACEAAEERKTVALLVRDQRLAAASQAVFASEPDLGFVEVIVPAQLRGEDCYGQIIAAGSDNLFPEHVFSSPRAPAVCLIHYHWISSGSEIEPLLRGSAGAVRTWAANRSTSGPAHKDDLPAEEFVPVFDWERAMARARRGGPAGLASEQVGARLSLLEGGWAVFLDAGDGATVQAVDLEEERALQLKRVSVNRIEQGMFVILRTEGGGDYVVPLADRILGEAAGRMRELQEDWKERLRQAVHSRGLSPAAAQLRRYGAQKASEQNVRNWMSARNIKPALREDFGAIMRLVGLEERAEEYWRAMETITQAHMKAGYHIRKLLLRAVLAADPGELEKNGRKDFNLVEAVGAVLTAFRVEDISREAVMVLPSRIGVPFKLGGHLWR